MKGKLRTVEEKVRILRQADGERTILEICDEHNVSEQTFYRRKKGFGLLDVKQAQRLKELEEENGRLKSIVADQGFGMEILQEALEKKVVNPGHKRQVAQGFVAEGRCSGPTACQYFSLHRSTYRDAAKELNGWQKRLRAAVRCYSLKKRKWGYMKITRLLKDDGWSVGKRQVQRIRRELGLRLVSCVQGAEDREALAQTNESESEVVMRTEPTDRKPLSETMVQAEREAGGATDWRPGDPIG